MNSRFYNTGSLGEPRWANSFMSSMDRRPSFRFGTEPGRPPTGVAKPTVLVVEDDDNSLFVLKSILVTKGYRVLEAWDGRQAVEVAEVEKLDLILLDLQLPKLSGLGVILHLRENANLESLPIVIMTGCDPEKFRGSAIAAGCDAFLVKPIDFDSLDAVLDLFVPLRDAP
jgi:two-component system phosphate regulon response regulator PhoB